MKNFEYYVPTKIYFGKDTHLKVGEIIKSYGYKKILLHYGKGSIKKNGLYQRIIQSLNENEIEFVDFGGVEANPKLSFVKKGVDICRKESCEMILAVGGGSVIDSAKVMGVSVCVDFDPWEFFLKKEEPKKALPVGTVLTIAASGSEMSSSAVITNEEIFDKRGFNSSFNRPLFSILNPELTFPVDAYQTGCGIVDIMMHTLERYFSGTENADLTDRIAESILKSVIKAGKEVMTDLHHYEARETLMWAGSLSHNDLTGLGLPTFMECHQICHILSGLYDNIAHAAGLSVIFPAWAKYIYKHNIERFCQYAVNVWNLEMDFKNPGKTALAGIMATEAFFESIGMPIRLSEFNISGMDFTEMSKMCTFYGKRVLPSYIPLGEKEIKEIFELAK